MKTIKLKGLVDENKKLSLTLPPGTPSGEVDVIVMVDTSDLLGNSGTDSLQELLTFHKGRRLNGLSLKELAMEGQR